MSILLTPDQHFFGNDKNRDKSVKMLKFKPKISYHRKIMMVRWINESNILKN